MNISPFNADYFALKVVKTPMNGEFMNDLHAICEFYNPLNDIHKYPKMCNKMVQMGNKLLHQGWN